MSTAISSNKFDILRSDDENERNYEEQAGGGGGVVAKYDLFLKMGASSSGTYTINVYILITY